VDLPAQPLGERLAVLPLAFDAGFDALGSLEMRL
jgi:hypothetical protein